ncbi:hypothetical protein GCM10010517_74220 [Streptosporangium fragile]|uniref:PKD domain-containing protein n=1 Tax=Streptosporangium fragile TaxID=46186 RepID=A0ABN3WBT2_9ACTN
MHFSARISVRLRGAPVTVRYRWVADDGSRGPVRSAVFRGRGTAYRTVRDYQEFDEDTRGWQRLQILGPGRFLSSRARFDVRDCGEDDPGEPDPEPVASATLHASPTSYTGPCGNGQSFTFTGRISVTDGPATVRWRWKDSLNSGAAENTIRFSGTGPQSETVSIPWGPGASGTYWMQIEILAPNTATSERAVVSLTCT